jgi:hypothetical protein
MTITNTDIKRAAANAIRSLGTDAPFADLMDAAFEALPEYPNDADLDSVEQKVSAALSRTGA